MSKRRTYWLVVQVFTRSPKTKVAVFKQRASTTDSPDRPFWNDVGELLKRNGWDLEKNCAGGYQKGYDHMKEIPVGPAHFIAAWEGFDGQTPGPFNIDGITRNTACQRANVRPLQKEDS